MCYICMDDEVLVAVVLCIYVQATTSGISLLMLSACLADLFVCSFETGSLAVLDLSKDFGLIRLSLAGQHWDCEHVPSCLPFLCGSEDRGCEVLMVA